MSSEVEFRVEGERLIVEVSGTHDPDESVQRFRRITLTCRSMQLTEVLIDCREMEGEWSALTEIIYTSQITAIYRSHRKNGGRPIRLAYVALGAIVGGWNPGVETAQEDGMDLYVTTDIDAAIAWLDRA